MGSPEVGQLQLLNRLLKRTLEEARPRNAAVLGCTTGNGFEHFDLAVTQHILGVDINPSYLRVAGERFAHFGTCLELKCADVTLGCFGSRRYDLVHAALLFEYVEPLAVLGHIRQALKKQGILSVVLQLPNAALPTVSQTAYTARLAGLSAIFRHFGRDEFCELAARQGFLEMKGETITLANGKSFYYGKFHKRHSGA